MVLISMSKQFNTNKSVIVACSFANSRQYYFNHIYANIYCISKLLWMNYYTLNVKGKPKKYNVKRKTEKVKAKNINNHKVSK
jgi:hypothetical protein